MSDEDEVRQLQAIPLFAEVPPEILQRVAVAASPFEVAPAHVLVEHGQPGSGMFLILEGRVSVELPGREPLELGPGEFFGELALLTDVERVARVQAVTEVRGLAVSRMDFAALLEDEPRVAVGMLPVLAKRLVEAETA